MRRETDGSASRLWSTVVLACILLTWHAAAQSRRSGVQLGQEMAVPRHLQDGDEFRLSLAELLAFGEKLFTANWTEQDGGGRPLSKGTGSALSDRARPLKASRGFNRISGPDANSCQGCHNAPYGITGGGGDFVTNAFEQAQRFDFVTFDRTDATITKGALDESQRPVSLQTVGRERSTPGLFGAGYIEMLARQITGDLQRIRDSIQPGQSKALVSKGVSFGSLARRADGRWETSQVEGLPRSSVQSSARGDRPTLVLRPWHQAGSVASLREMTDDSYNQHHGIQPSERFGADADPDGDGVVNELTRADVTAVTVFQATLAVPGRVIPNDPEVERAVLSGERLFEQVHCTTCHVPSLPLDRGGWIYSEPGPYSLQGSRVPRTLEVDLTSSTLPAPRLLRSHGDTAVVQVPAYTDFKLHDITGSDIAGTDAAAAGRNEKYLTRRLWGVANEPPYFHHGLFTTMRQAVLAHAGEALAQRLAFQRLTKAEQDAVIEFLKSLQVLPPGTKDLVVDEHHQKKMWPPATQSR